MDQFALYRLVSVGLFVLVGGRAIYGQALTALPPPPRAMVMVCLYVPPPPPVVVGWCVCVCVCMFPPPLWLWSGVCHVSMSFWGM